MSSEDRQLLPCAALDPMISFQADFSQNHSGSRSGGIFSSLSPMMAILPGHLTPTLTLTPLIPTAQIAKLAIMTVKVLTVNSLSKTVPIAWKNIARICITLTGGAVTQPG